MEWISHWAETIIVAVVIGTIIEMILPEGNSKKYIKMVIGVYILFTIISPVISKFTGNSIQVSDLLDLDQYINEVNEKAISENLQEQNQNTIKNVYIANLKNDVINKLNGKGYKVDSINIKISDDENYTLEKITLYLDKNENDNQKQNSIMIVEKVNEINVHIENNILNDNLTAEEDTKSNLTEREKSEVRKYLSEIYEISEEDIIIT